MQMPPSGNPLGGASSGPAHCGTADTEANYDPDANCYASDGSCASCDAGYVPVSSLRLPPGGGRRRHLQQPQWSVHLLLITERVSRPSPVGAPAFTENMTSIIAHGACA